MIIDRDTDRILRSWFQEPAAPLPDRVLDDVLGAVAGVRQRGRLWPFFGFSRHASALRLALVAAMLLALIGGLLLFAGSRTADPPRAFPTTEDTALDAGDYVIDAPFEVRVGLRVPPGWVATGAGAGEASLLRNEPAPWAHLVLQLPQAVVIDPCNPGAGLRDDVGPSIDDFAAAIASLPGIEASAPQRTSIGGRPAWAMTLRAPDSSADCPPEDPALILWDLPFSYGLSLGVRHRLWIVDVAGRRLVIAASDSGPESAGAHDIDQLVASLAFDVGPAPRAPASRGTPEPTIAPLPTSGAVSPGVYRLDVPRYAVDASGRPSRLPGAYEMVFEVRSGWRVAPGGVAAGPPGRDDAALRATAIAAVHLDPCHWRSGTLGDADPALLRDSKGTARAVSAWWLPDPDPEQTGPGYARPPMAPVSEQPVFGAWNGLPARSLAIAVPSELDLASCDDGEYRLWTSPLGVARTAMPGESILLWAIDLDGAVVVLDASHLPAADPATQIALGVMVDTVWIGPPLPR